MMSSKLYIRGEKIFFGRFAAVEKLGINMHYYATRQASGPNTRVRRRYQNRRCKVDIKFAATLVNNWINGYQIAVKLVLINDYVRNQGTRYFSYVLECEKTAISFNEQHTKTG